MKSVTEEPRGDTSNAITDLVDANSATRIMESTMKELGELDTRTAEDKSEEDKRFNKLRLGLNRIYVESISQIPVNGDPLSLLSFIRENPVFLPIAEKHMAEVLTVWQNIATRYSIIASPGDARVLAFNSYLPSHAKIPSEELKRYKHTAEKSGYKPIHKSSLRTQIEEAFIPKNMKYYRKYSQDWYYLYVPKGGDFGVAEYMKFSFNKFGELLPGVKIAGEEYHKVPSQNSVTENIT